MITKEKALDILDRMDFFQGQRAGRELWNEKSRYVQEMDLQIFREDVAELKAYIADVAPKSEVEALEAKIAQCQLDLHYSVCREDDAAARTAREIFEDIEKCRVIGSYGVCGYLIHDIAEIQKKYIGENK